MSDLQKLINEVLSLNPKAGELGEGKANNLQELAEKVKKDLDSKGYVVR